MAQRFDARKYSIKDFDDWNINGELVLSPKFQRRKVWPPKAQSYLIDSIVRGKPIPQLFMRQEINPKNKITRREIVDGQQRLRTVLDFLKDAFPVLKIHNQEVGGKYFSQLNEDLQREIFNYEFSVDLLNDVTDNEVIDIFARVNTFSVTLNAQELRNAQWFGDFKTSVYELSTEFTKFWQENSIFSDQNILRMAEAEFVSELLIAMAEGIKAKTKPYIDNYYKDHDEVFINRKTFEKRFREVIDIIGNIFVDSLSESKFREPRMLYPLYCSIYHMQYSLPNLNCSRKTIKIDDYAKLRTSLQGVGEIFEKLGKETERKERIEAGEDEVDLLEEEKNERILAGESEEDVIEDINYESEARKNGIFDPLTGDERAFYEAYNTHWVHAENRILLAEFICNLINKKR